MSHYSSHEPGPNTVPRTQPEHSVVVVVVVLVVVLVVADGDHSGHGHGHDHVCGHDLLWLPRD